MGEEVVAVTLKVVADEIGVVAVRDKANAFREERVFGRDLLETHWPLLARDLRDAGKLVHELARRDAAQRECEADAQRQAMQHRGEWEADQGRREGAAENDDDR